ncbi:hypothetical protein BDZ89DRAFT_1128933 [Hymenopellis radicata]|nr:hypothetical protein BDZ89DRAFT_1128933 [Hymenopellis radicata]
MVQLDDEGDLPSQVWVLRSSHQAPDTRVCATSRPKSPHLRTIFDNGGPHGAKGVSSSDTAELSALDDVLDLECLAWDFDDTVAGRDHDILFSDHPASPDSTKEIQWIPIPITVEGVEASSNFRSTSASSPQVVAIAPRVNSGKSFHRSELPVISYVPLITYVGQSTVAQNESDNVSSSEEPSRTEAESLSPLSHRGIAALVEATEYHNSRDAEMGWACALTSTGLPDLYAGRGLSPSSPDGKSDRARTRLISTTVDEDGHEEISQDLFINGPHTPYIASAHSSSEVESAQIRGNSFSVYKALPPTGVLSSPQHSSLAAPSQARATSAAPLGAPVATDHAFSSLPSSTVHGVATPRLADAVDIVAIGQSPLTAATNVDDSISIGTDFGLCDLSRA